MTIYDKNTVYNEFRHVDISNEFIEFLNLVYDRVKSTPIEVVMSLLPIDYHGYGGTYHEKWMVSEVDPTEYYNFKLRAKIFDWYGDRSTTDIITAVADTKDDLYRRLLVQYMWYLLSYLEYSQAKTQLENIISKLAIDNVDI